MPTSEELWPGVRSEAARRLLQAGLESFARRGYHAATTRDIAAAAGMSPAALYVHFSSKLALLFAISKSGHEQTLGLVEKIVAEETTPVSTMRRMVAEFVAWHARRHTRATVIQYELHALDAEKYTEIAALRRRTEQLFRDTVTRGIEHGDFKVADTKTAARAIVSLGIDVARWYTDQTPTPPQVLGERYADLVLSMLAAQLPHR